jgi:hypothetical protein
MVVYGLYGMFLVACNVYYIVWSPKTIFFLDPMFFIGALLSYVVLCACVCIGVNTTSKEKHTIAMTQTSKTDGTQIGIVNNYNTSDDSTSDVSEENNSTSE